MKDNNLPDCAADSVRCQVTIGADSWRLELIPWTWIWLKIKNNSNNPENCFKIVPSSENSSSLAKVGAESVQEMICEFHQRADLRG